jgi:hypothetical protein
MTRWLFRKLLPLALLAAGCQNTTGGARINFRAAAAGPALAPADIPSFLNILEFDVTLSSAVLHIGAIYLNGNPNISTADNQFGCYGGGRNLGQVLGGLDVDLLSPDPQPFPVIGEGTQTEFLAQAASVWLTGTKRVDDPNDSQVILSIAGVAQRANQRYPFQGELTIGNGRLVPPQNPNTPGVNPICKERIVAPIPIRINLVDDGLLLVRIDPFDLFAVTDFSQLKQVTTNPPLYVFTKDRVENVADLNLYANLRTASSYRFVWQPAQGRAR